MIGDDAKVAVKKILSKADVEITTPSSKEITEIAVPPALVHAFKRQQDTWARDWKEEDPPYDMEYHNTPIRSNSFLTAGDHYFAYRRDLPYDWTQGLPSQKEIDSIVDNCPFEMEAGIPGYNMQSIVGKLELYCMPSNVEFTVTADHVETKDLSLYKEMRDIVESEEYVFRRFVFGAKHSTSSLSKNSFAGEEMVTESLKRKLKQITAQQELHRNVSGSRRYYRDYHREENLSVEEFEKRYFSAWGWLKNEVGRWLHPGKSPYREVHETHVKVGELSIEVRELAWNHDGHERYLEAPPEGRAASSAYDLTDAKGEVTICE